MFAFEDLIKSVFQLPFEFNIPAIKVRVFKTKKGSIAIEFISIEEKENADKKTA